jgi:hypothetical protein
MVPSETSRHRTHHTQDATHGVPRVTGTQRREAAWWAPGLGGEGARLSGQSQLGTWEALEVTVAMAAQPCARIKRR